MQQNSTHGRNHCESRRTSYNRNDGRLGRPGMEHYQADVTTRTTSDDSPPMLDDSDHAYRAPLEDQFSYTGGQFQPGAGLGLPADTTTEKPTTPRCGLLNDASRNLHAKSAQMGYTPDNYFPSQNRRPIQHRHADRAVQSASLNNFNAYNTPPRAIQGSASPAGWPSHPSAWASGPRTNANSNGMPTFQVVTPQPLLVPTSYRGNLLVQQTSIATPGHAYPSIQTAPRSSAWPSPEDQQRSYQWSSLVTRSEVTTPNSSAPSMNRLSSTQSSHTTSSFQSASTTTASIDSYRSAGLPLSPTPASDLDRQNLRGKLRARVYRCDFPSCDETCARPDDLDRHKATSHAASDVHYHCPNIVCHYWNSRRDKVRLHLRKKHADEDVTEDSIIKVTDDDLIRDGACRFDPNCPWYPRRWPYLYEA